MARAEGWVRRNADAEVSRYLTFAAHRRNRWEYASKVWERDDEGWYTLEPAVDPRDMRRDGRAPAVISEDTVNRWGQVREARSTAASEIKDALRGQEQVPAENADGSERVDYKVNLKNADGTLNKAGKALMDIHGRTSRIEQSAAEATKSEVSA